MAERILAIGDIHGCNSALDALLDVVQPIGGDTIVVLGDVVDRGPDTRACIERLLAVSRSVELIHLMGNHEEMMLAARESVPALRYWRIAAA